MRKKLHILIASADDPRDIKSWSGIPFQVYKQMELHFDKVTVVHYNRPKRNLITGLLRLILGARRYPLWLTKIALRGFAHELVKAVNDNKPDVVISISSQGLVYSKLDVPTFLFTDAPWIVWKKTYADFEPLPLLGSGYGFLEAKAAKSITGVILGSKWAAQEAETVYGIGSDRIGVVALGASWFPNCDETDLLAAFKRRGAGGRIRLLFVGRDWQRKGGPEALEIVKAIKALGLAVVLEIVGCRPVIPAEYEALTNVYGLLFRDNPQHKKNLEELFLESDFLITPGALKTEPECLI